MPLPEGRRIFYISPSAFTPGKGHRVSFVFENDPNHYPTGNTPEGGDTEPWYWGNADDEPRSFEEAEATARQQNERRGISLEEELNILVSSMFPGLFNVSGKAKTINKSSSV